MFDSISTSPRDVVLERARSFMCEYGHMLAAAAAWIGGASSEARVISTAIEIETAQRMTRRIYLRLDAIHRTISLSSHEEYDPFDDDLFLAFDPASREVEEVCLLTDLLADILCEIRTCLRLQ
jgi:hypothetical protein